MPWFTSHRFLLFFLRFVVLYAILLFVCFSLPLARVVIRLEAAAADTVLRATESPPVTKVVRERDGDILAFPEHHPAPYALDGGLFVYNLLLVAALIGATPGLRGLQGVRLLAVGGAVLIVVNVFGVIGWTKYNYTALPPAVAPQYGMLTRQVYRLAAELFSVGVGQMLPVAAVYFYVLRELTRVAPGTPVARNDLCPCGSGHKYKRCCGG